MTTDPTAPLQALQAAAERLPERALAEMLARGLVFRNRHNGRLYVRRARLEELADAVKQHLLEDLPE